MNFNFSKLKQIRVPAVILGAAFIVCTAIPASRAASEYDKYFASRIEAVPDDSNNRGTNYTIIFTPTSNEYSYEVQYAGKNSLGGNACWHGDSAVRMSIEQLKSLKIVTDVGGQLEVKKGENGVDASGNLHGSVNQEKNIDVNRVFGRKYERNPAIVFREFHWRVVAKDQSGKPKYTTGWNGGQGEDIRKWDWNGDCAWVKLK